MQRWSQRIAGNKRRLPAEIVDEIVERTDGVPLFVEELTKAVVEADEREYGAKLVLSRIPAAALAVPATLHASLMARLDRLGPAAKELAQVGAAIGREFSYELLAAIAAPRPELEVAECVESAGRGRAALSTRHAARGNLPLQARAGARRRLLHSPT